MTEQTDAIPHAPTVPFLGNALDLDKAVPLNSFVLLAKQYGEIYQLTLGGNVSVFSNPTTTELAALRVTQVRR